MINLELSVILTLFRGLVLLSELLLLFRLRYIFILCFISAVCYSYYSFGYCPVLIFKVY